MASCDILSTLLLIDDGTRIFVVCDCSVVVSVKSTEQSKAMLRSHLCVSYFSTFFVLVADRMIDGLGYSMTESGAV